MRTEYHQDTYVHRQLSCGIELAVQPFPSRNIVSFNMRFLAGYAFEPPDRLGLAHVLDEVITKGTARRDGRALNDAFDEIGAAHGSYAGRETFGFSAMCLPEFIDRCIELHAEFLRTPTFPDEAFRIALDLTRQELAAMDDDPGDLAKKHLHLQAYGQPLGRHPMGEPETLASITRDDLVHHWQTYFAPSRMMVAVAGNVDPTRLADKLEECFTGWNTAETTFSASVIPEFTLDFKAARTHHPKKTEQQQIVLCFPGAARTDDDYHVEEVLLGVLSGGMSSRLFAEVREKQGLVYWVDAWSDHPRGSGLVHLGASSTPENVDRTLDTLLREIDRVAQDLTQEEVTRAITGLVAQSQTRGDVTRVRANRMADALFYHHSLEPEAQRLNRISSVTIDDIRRYLSDHPRDRISIVTLGPKGSTL